MNEKLKRGLELCANWTCWDDCDKCPYYGSDDCECGTVMARDVLAEMEKLEAKAANKQMVSPVRRGAQFQSFEIRELTSDKTGTEFEIVKWTGDEEPHCFTIGYLEYSKKEEAFELRSCGMRYAECGTAALNEWVLRWCHMKEFEMTHCLEDDDE